MFISTGGSWDLRFRKNKKICRGSCTQQDPKYFFFLVLNKKPCNRKQVLKNQKETQSIEFRVVHIHNPWGQVRKQICQQAHGIVNTHVCLHIYIHIYSFLTMDFVTYWTYSYHLIMDNGQMQIFKCSKLRSSQIWWNVQKHFSGKVIFIVLGISLHTKPAHLPLYLLLKYEM